jgi:cytochrome c-type biogenesis protein CcmF
MDIYSEGKDIIYGQLGHFFIILSFVSALVSTIAYFLATQFSANKTHSIDWISFGRKAFIINTISVVAILSLLYIILLTHAFQYKYVWQHSSKELPFYYVFSAMWAGQEGSTLLWMFWISVVGCALIIKAKAYESGVLFFISLTQVLLGSMLLGIYILEYKLGSSPFALLKDTMDIPIFKMNPSYIPEDGTGLNPSLQNYWMVIHPPTLFLGFALTTVPAAFAFTSLWKKEYQQFANAALPWTLLTLMILGAGILMGGAWAYEALSFGGFWAWDPVENASLVPWLVLAAGLHTLLAYKHTGYSLHATYLLLLSAFLLVLYSSFLTKSGVLGDASVHSFTDMGMSGQLVVTIVIFLIPTLFLFFYRNYRKEIPSKQQEEKTYSREFWLFIGALFFVVAAIHIIVLTSFPVINKLPFIKNKLAPPSDIIAHYNNVQIWLATFVAIAAGITQYFKYTQTDTKLFYKNFLLSLGLSLVFSLFFIIPFQIYRIDYILLLFAAWFVVFANAEYIFKVLKRKIKVSGGSVSHIGFGLVLIGIIISQGKQEVISLNSYGINYGSGFTSEESAENILLYKDEPQKMGKYKVTYLGDSVGGKNIYFNVLYQKIKKDGSFGKQFLLKPNILINQKMGNNPVPSTKKTLSSDLYTHITMAPLKEDGSQPDSIVKDTYTIGIGDTIMASNAFAIVESINPNANIDGFEKKQGDVAVGIQLRYIDLDTQYIMEPIYFIRDMFATSIAANSHDNQVRIAVSKIIPEENKFEFIVEQKLNKYIIMKAIKFPFINILWFGIIVMLFGIYLSVQKRINDNKRLYAKN